MEHPGGSNSTAYRGARRVRIATIAGLIVGGLGPLIACDSGAVPPGTGAGPGAETTPVVRYAIHPVPTDTLMHLRVSVTARGESDGTTRFALSQDRFGVPEMWRWIRDVRGDPGARLVSQGAGVYEVRHEPGDRFTVSYTVAYDPPSAGFRPFGPSVGAGHFHFFGSQWMARVGAEQGSRDVERDVEVVLEAGDWEGSWASSFGVGPGPHRIRANDYDLDYSVIAGGDYVSRTTDCRDRPVVVVVQGDFTVAASDVSSMAGTIVCGQREIFSDFDRPFFTVFVTERPGLKAGAPLLNGFTAFLESSTSRDEFVGLLAHEMIHTWLPRTARLVDTDAEDPPESRTRWFHEGFTEYLARLMLVERELMPRSWMVERTNEDLRRLAYQPYRTSTIDDIASASLDGRYNGVHHRLHYLRGALLALNWDTRIRRNSEGDRSIVDPVRLVTETAKEGDGTIGLENFLSIFKEYGIDAASDVERHLRARIPIQPEPDAFAPGYELSARGLPEFEPGFDLVHWLESSESRVAGVTAGSAADRAGLRNGMTIVDSDNAAPWFGRWRPAERSIFVVESEDGRRRRLEILSAGEAFEVPVFLSSVP